MHTVAPQANLHALFTGVELEPQEKLSLLEWLANEYKRFGCQLECVRAAQWCSAVLSATCCSGL